MATSLPSLKKPLSHGGPLINNYLRLLALLLSSLGLLPLPLLRLLLLLMRLLRFEWLFCLLAPFTTPPHRLNRFELYLCIAIRKPPNITNTNFNTNCNNNKTYNTIDITFIDTADMYGSGPNEQLIAKVLKTRRSEVVPLTSSADLTASFWASETDPDYVREANQKWLERLEVDSIDEYYQHGADPKTPIEDTAVKHLGPSEASAATIRRAYAVHPIATLQIESSASPSSPTPHSAAAFSRAMIKSVDDLAANDSRRYLPRFQGDNFAKNLKLVDEQNRVAAAKGATTS
ncbi:NADP-dependent oxidoreductase domain-containing protein [Zopfochytrium polystomum]|nr:NADP-dependent oxidoreductase domain-containing protein [Zopfochytrium polystomum]